MAARFHGLFPGVTANLFSLVNRVLPTAAGNVTDRVRGMDVYPRVRSRWLDWVLAPSLSAARRFNELGHSFATADHSARP